MPRTREFDPQDALVKAMNVFWKKGYANTSIEDLVAATGVSRYGLYGEFASKRGLFLACLDHYQDDIVEMAFGIVERPDASLANIRDYFQLLLKLSTTESGRLGCLMSNTANDVAPHDVKAANKVEKYRQRLLRGFVAALMEAKRSGELSNGFDVERTADFLVGVVHGLSVMARSRADSRMMTNVVAIALDSLK